MVEMQINIPITLAPGEKDHSIELTCIKCTRAAKFTGRSEADALRAARRKRWTMTRGAFFVCPKCWR